MARVRTRRREGGEICGKRERRGLCHLFDMLRFKPCAEKERGEGGKGVLLITPAAVHLGEHMNWPGACVSCNLPAYFYNFENFRPLVLLTLGRATMH